MKGLDDDINVATVHPDGAVRIYGRIDDEGHRPFIRAQEFPNYGSGKLYADEYEEAQRQERPIARR